MKKFLTAIAVLTALSAAAQTTYGGAEQPRRPLRPYATVEEAEADAGNGRYVVQLTEWTRGESDGRTRFTSEFVYPAAWLNRQIIIRIESASSGYSVEVGGRSAGSVTSGSVPAEFNITKLAESGINKVSIVVDRPESNEPFTRPDIAWVGNTEIVCQPTVRVRDFDCRTTLNDNGDGIFEVAIAVKTDALNPKTARISYELNAGETLLAAGYRDVKLEMRGEDTVRFVAIVPDSLLWSPDSPSLLRLGIRNKIEGRYAENISVAVGAREVRYDGKDLYVNGRRQQLNLRKVDAAVSAEELAELRERGFNAVSVEAGYAPLGLYGVCDAAGMFVIPQVASDTSNGGRSIRKGGNPSNDPALTGEFLSRTRAMYHTSKNHPSVVAFSLGGGITNGINPYEGYLLLKSLDGSRPVVYDGAGREWNSDRFDIQIYKPLQ